MSHLLSFHHVIDSYHLIASGDFLFVSVEGTTALQAAPADGRHVCWLCGTQEKAPRMRDHIARHLVNAKLNRHEKLQNPVSITGFIPVHHLSDMNTRLARLPVGSVVEVEHVTLTSSRRRRPKFQSQTALSS